MWPLGGLEEGGRGYGPEDETGDSLKEIHSGVVEKLVELGLQLLKVGLVVLLGHVAEMSGRDVVVWRNGHALLVLLNIVVCLAISDGGFFYYIFANEEVLILRVRPANPLSAAGPGGGLEG